MLKDWQNKAKILKLDIWLEIRKRTGWGDFGKFCLSRFFLSIDNLGSEAWMYGLKMFKFCMLSHLLPLPVPLPSFVTSWCFFSAACNSMPLLPDALFSKLGPKSVTWNKLFHPAIQKFVTWYKKAFFCVFVILQLHCHFRFYITHNLLHHSFHKLFLI